jgi:hypothetical protein
MEILKSRLGLGTGDVLPRLIHPARWGWPRPNKLGLLGAQQFIKHTQLRERPNRPKRLVQWGKGDSPF